MTTPAAQRAGVAWALRAGVVALAASAAAGARADEEPGRREVAAVRIEVAIEAARPGEQVPVTVLVLDGRGAPVDAFRVELESLTGTVGPLAREREGVHRATLTIPRSLPRGRSAVLFAKADGRTSEHALALAAGPPSVLELFEPTSVAGVEDGPRHLALSVLDAFGNPAEVEPRASARDRPLPVRRVGPGLWSVEYEPPSAEYGQDDEIVVEVGDARASRKLRLVRDGRRLAATPWLGAALAPARGLAAGANLSAWWLADPDELGVLVDLGWWRLADRSAVALPGGPAGVARERSYLPLTAAFGWSHRLRPRLTTTASLGAGGAIVATSQRLAGQPTITEAGWAPAASAACTLGWRVGGGVAFGELRGVWIGDAHLPAASGATRTLLLLGGYRYDAR